MSQFTSMSDVSFFIFLLLFRLANVFFLGTWVAADETWQSSEVAHWLVFGYGHLSWEWGKDAAIRYIACARKEILGPRHSGSVFSCIVPWAQPYFCLHLKRVKLSLENLNLKAYISSLRDSIISWIVLRAQSHINTLFEAGQVFLRILKYFVHINSCRK